MTQSIFRCGLWKNWAPRCRLSVGATALTAFLSLTGCTTTWKGWKHLEHPEASGHFDRGKEFFAAGKYEDAFRENKLALTDGQSPPDVALFNMGLISAYSLNPKKDYPTALGFFRMLVHDYPNSSLVEQSKVWIHVLEERQKIAEEKIKLAEQKRALTRERELLTHEREKLKYMIEKSRQVDIEIEKRRRRTLMR